jgi:hypothetical protein
MTVGGTLPDGAVVEEDTWSQSKGFEETIRCHRSGLATSSCILAKRPRSHSISIGENLPKKMLSLSSPCGMANAARKSAVFAFFGSATSPS